MMLQIKTAKFCYNWPHVRNKKWLTCGWALVEREKEKHLTHIDLEGAPSILITHSPIFLHGNVCTWNSEEPWCTSNHASIHECMHASVLTYIHACIHHPLAFFWLNQAAPTGYTYIEESCHEGREMKQLFLATYKYILETLKKTQTPFLLFLHWNLWSTFFYTSWPCSPCSCSVFNLLLKSSNFWIASNSHITSTSPSHPRSQAF